MGIWYDARPADPLEVNEVFLPKFEYGRIEEALTFFDCEFTRLEFDNSYWELEAHDNERVMLANFNFIVQ